MNYRERLQRLSVGTAKTTGTLRWSRTIDEADDSVAALFGLSAEQIRGRLFSDLVDDEAVAYLSRILPRLKDDATGLYRLRRSPQSVMYVEWEYRRGAEEGGIFHLTFWEADDASDSDVPEFALRVMLPSIASRG